jgi:hypothetical protein
MRSVKEMLCHVFSGCPKRIVCSFYQAKGKTCIYGPYRYCGKYRSIVEPKSKEEMTHIIT